MFDLDLKSRIPIYEQLMERMKELIIQGVIKPDERLPSVRSLARELAINPNTIQRAYRELEGEHYIYSLPGKGSFVNRMAGGENSERVKSLSQQFRQLAGELFYLGVTKEQLVALIEHEERRMDDET